MTSNISVPASCLVEQKVRLVIEAECSTCGPLFQTEPDPLTIIGLATAHTAASGHVVILHGTSDVPDCDDSGAPPPLSNFSPDSHNHSIGRREP